MVAVDRNDNSFADVKPGDLARLAKVEHYLVATAFLKTVSAERLTGRALLCAILFGGLLDPATWSCWLKKILEHDWLASHERIYYTIDGPTDREWYPDPLTGCVLAKLRGQLSFTNKVPHWLTVPEIMVQDALDALAAHAKGSPHERDISDAAACGPEWLVKACTARLQMRVPALLANHAAGRVETHKSRSSVSAADNAAYRLADFVASATSVTAWQPWFLDAALGHLWVAFFPNDPKAPEQRILFGKSMRNALDTQIAGWRRPAKGESVHLHILTWLRQRLDPDAPRSSSLQSKIGPSTARQYLAQFAALDWKTYRKKSIKGREAAERLNAVFKELSQIAEEISPKNGFRLLAALASFSDYLHSRNPAIALRPAPKRPPNRPRAIVVDDKQFTELLEMLRQWGASSAKAGEPDRGRRSRNCALAAVLMFRTGLRGSEVANLALNDIVFEGDVSEIEVRGSTRQENKTPFSYRILPLHVLLRPQELEDFRQWHAGRCDEEFWNNPRAFLFPADLGKNLSLEQYLLEPIDAGIRILFGESLNPTKTRSEPGYWFALTSPLRHSFASHLMASLLLPDGTINLPMPTGWTPDLVSAGRKQKLTSAFLPQNHTGLSIMQVVRYLMGHASYTQSLATYIHNIDWLLAAHLWRDYVQPPVSLPERTAYLNLLPQLSQRSAVQHRQLQRNNASAFQQASVPIAIAQSKRGRPPKAKAQAMPTAPPAYIDYLGRYIAPPAFSKRKTTVQAVQVPSCHRIEAPARSWLALDNFLRWRRRGIGVKRAADQLALPLDACLRWEERAGPLAQIQMPPRSASKKLQASRGVAGAARLRFTALADGFDRPCDGARQIIDAIWETQQAGAVPPRKLQAILTKLSRWPTTPSKSGKAIVQYVAFLEKVGVPAHWLELGAADRWQGYSPDLLVAVPKGGMQLTAVQLASESARAKLFHDTVVHGLLLLVIDSNADIDALVERCMARHPSVPSEPFQTCMLASAN